MVDFGKRNREKAKRLEKERIKKNIRTDKDLIKYVNQNKHKINKEFEEELMEGIQNKKITTKTQIFKIIERKTKENKITNDINDNELEETKKCSYCGMLVNKEYDECPVCHNQTIKSKYIINPEVRKRQLEKRKLRKIVENSGLSYLSQQVLREKINRKEIIDDDDLKNAINNIDTILVNESINENIKRYEKQRKLEKIVENADLELSFKKNLKSRIKSNAIVDEFYLKYEIRKCKLIEYVDKSDLMLNQKRRLKQKIQENKIIDEYDLKDAIHDELIEAKKGTRSSIANSWGHRPYEEIAEDICYIEDFDDWDYDGNGITFYRYGTGMYSSKHAHYDYDDLARYDN